MSIFGSFKRAFGFSDTEDDYLDEGIDATVHKPGTSPSNNRQEQNNAENAVTEEDAGDIVIPQELSQGIFDGVVAIFNQALPDFIKTCVDVEAQRKYIYDSLDESLKAYIDKVGEEARKRSVMRWENERKKVQTEMLQLKEQHRLAEESRADWQRQQLSAERQKRALTERLHDLENQIVKLEAEKEQYDLENKSLINKLKVSNVKDGDIEVMRQEIEALQARLQEARGADKSGELQALVDSANASIAEKDELIQSLQAKLENAGNAGAADADVEALNAQIEAMTAENKRLADAVEQLQTKEKIADVMINELNAKASEAVRELDDKKQSLDALSGEHAGALSEIERLKEKVALASQELQASQEELEEMRSGLQAVDEIQEQLTRFEEIKKKKDARISELTDETKRQVERIAKLEEEAKSLKKTIEKNLYSQVESERILKKRIEELSAQVDEAQRTEVTSAPVETYEKPAKKKRQVKISAIDESLDDTDWLVSVPPPGTPTRPASASEADFGYQAPVRKSTPENDAQMSLW